jgi:hypothetical protein
MTPKELEFFYTLIEKISEEVYRLGYEDAKAGNPLKTEGFSLSKASRLVIKTNLKKHVDKS